MSCDERFHFVFRSGEQNVSVGRVSIGILMKLTAIIAVNLALIRAVPDLLLFQAPPFLFLIVVLDLALIQALAFGRPLRTFYFTFLIVGIVSTGVVTALCTRDVRPPRLSLHILETAIQHYRAVRGESQAISPYIEYPWLTAAERCVTSMLALCPALVAAVLASRWMHRRCKRLNIRGQIVAAFLQGALVGVGLLYLPGLILASFFLDKKHEWQAMYLLVPLVTCPLLGGLAFASLTRRRFREHQGETLTPG